MQMPVTSTAKIAKDDVSSKRVIVWKKLMLSKVVMTSTFNECYDFKNMFYESIELFRRVQMIRVLRGRINEKSVVAMLTQDTDYDTFYWLIHNYTKMITSGPYYLQIYQHGDS